MFSQIEGANFLTESLWRVQCACTHTRKTHHKHYTHAIHTHGILHHTHQTQYVQHTRCAPHTRTPAGHVCGGSKEAIPQKVSLELGHF